MSKNTDPRIDDVRIIKSSGNVFADLGFDPAEAAVMAMRVELMVLLRERIEDDGLTQREAARLLGVTQPRISSLFKGAWRDFSLDMLVTLTERAGRHVTLAVV